MLRDHDERHSVVQSLVHAIAAGMGEERARMGQHVELGHGPTDDEVWWRRHKCIGVCLLTDGKEEPGLNAPERIDTRMEELRPHRMYGAQRHVDERLFPSRYDLDWLAASTRIDR